MLILDTDHFSALIRGTANGRRLRGRLAWVDGPFGLSIISVEECFRGWMAEIAKARSAEARLQAYGMLQRFTAAVALWTIVPWTQEGEEALASLVSRKLGIGAMDLRIASVALASDATLLTANARDFDKIDDLRTENWLDETRMAP